MISTNSQLRQKALASLTGRWGSAIITALIYWLITATFTISSQNAPYMSVVSLLVTIPLGYGFAIWYLNLFRSNDGAAPDVSTLFDGFKKYDKVFTTMLLVAVYTILWTLLLIIPGIIKSLSYAMTPYIINDNPKLKENQTIELSMAMMEGKKMKLFLMQLNFFAWVMLSILTLGIGLLWVIPYISTTMAAFYEDVKSDYESKNIASAVE